MAKSPDSVLSCLDMNGEPLADAVLWYAFRQLLGNNGYVHLVGVPESFDHVAFLKELGEFQPTSTGTLVGDVKPERGMDDVNHGQNRGALTPHTEGYEFQGLPPRYLALWCVTPPSGPGGETTLFDGNRILAEFTEDERRHLRDTVYRWGSTEGLARHGVTPTAEHPVLEEHKGEPILRFSTNYLTVPESDETARRLIDRGNVLFAEQHIAVRYQARDMVVWNNWRMLHSRNAFEDPSRHLKRVLIAA
ncbi:TauD/TfdA dioxygenase family protein [Nonomuraea sp. NPDC049400]|uniref:TauD/TfdA dioxygenase family protein n=1 Tax=Nonomuraea sp. NPDC049400 TaxID=3364352 RepID=UPI003797CF8A